MTLFFVTFLMSKHRIFAAFYKSVVQASSEHNNQQTDTDEHLINSQ